MYEAFESDEFAELLEDFESDEFAESDEWESDERARRAGKRRVRPRLPTAKRGSPVPKRAGPGYATKAELQATANRLDGRIAVNSKAVAALDGRTRALETETARLSAALRKETADRKLETAALKKDLDQARTNSMLLTLLNTPTTVQVKDLTNTTVDVVKKPSSIQSMLPLFFMMSGSSSGGGGFGGGGDSTASMLPMAMIALAK